MEQQTVWDNVAAVWLQIDSRMQIFSVRQCLSTSDLCRKTLIPPYGLVCFPGILGTVRLLDSA